MDLFVHDDAVTYIAVGGISPGRGTWRVGWKAVEDLVKCDWDYWGTIKLDMENACIAILGDAASLSVPALLVTDVETEEFIGDKLEVKGRIHGASADGDRTRPLRMTAVLVKRDGRWLFHQIHLSYSVRSLAK
jgi:hypothetical protein